MWKYFLVTFMMAGIQNIQSMEPEKPLFDKIDVQIINEAGNPISVALIDSGTNTNVSDPKQYSYQKITLPEDMIGFRRLQKRLLPRGIFDIIDFGHSNTLIITLLETNGIYPMKNISALTLKPGKFEKRTKIFRINYDPKQKELTQSISGNELSLQEQQNIAEGQVKKTGEYESLMGLTQKIGAWRRVLDLINDKTKSTISAQDIYDALDINTKDLNDKQKANALLDPSTFGLPASESRRDVYKRLLKIFASDFFNQKDDITRQKAHIVNQVINDANGMLKQ